MSPPGALENMGTVLMHSTPAAMTTSMAPEAMAWAAKWIACWEEPHWRSMVVPGTVVGSPAARAALRPMLVLCGPIWLTQPMMTSSTRAGSTPERPTSSFRVSAANSTGCQPEREPFRLPTGVRTASTMTGTDTVCLSASGTGRRERDAGRGRHRGRRRSGRHGQKQVQTSLGDGAVTQFLRGAAEYGGRPGPTEEQVRVVLPGEADTSGHLDQTVGRGPKHLRGLGLGQQAQAMIRTAAVDRTGGRDKQ